MSENNGHSTGLLGSMRSAFDSALGFVQDRIELLGIELQEEKLKLFQLILSAAALVALGSVTLVLLAITVVVAFWETARLPALCGLSAIYLIGTFAVYRKLRNELKYGRRALSATADEIRKDRQCLHVRN